MLASGKQPKLMSILGFDKSPKLVEIAGAYMMLLAVPTIAFSSQPSKADSVARRALGPSERPCIPCLQLYQAFCRFCQCAQPFPTGWPNFRSPKQSLRKTIRSGQPSYVGAKLYYHEFWIVTPVSRAFPFLGATMATMADVGHLGLSIANI